MEPIQGFLGVNRGQVDPQGGLGAVGCLAPVVLAAILFPVFTQARQAAVKVSCMSNLKQCALSQLIYANDYDDKYPAASAWISHTEPYSKNMAVYTCPTVKAEGKQYGYAFYKGLSGQLQTVLDAPSAMPMIFDSTILKKNAYSYLESVPKPGRHEASNNFAYADGHVRGVHDAQPSDRPATTGSL